MGQGRGGGAWEHGCCGGRAQAPEETTACRMAAHTVPIRFMSSRIRALQGASGHTDDGTGVIGRPISAMQPLGSVGSLCFAVNARRGAPAIPPLGFDGGCNVLG